MRELLLLIGIQNFLTPVQSVNGMIWNKKIGEFLPIFNVPAFAAMNQVLLNESRKLETHNFQGTVIRLSYYEISNLVVSTGNGTMVTGVIGEIWNTLAELLNFTTMPIKTNEVGVGIINENGTYTSGLMQYLQRYETDAIPRVEASVPRSTAAQFTVPLWKTSFRIYIQRDVGHTPIWIIKLFSRKVWYATVITFILLSLCTYLSRAVESKITYGESNTTLGNHIFYNFGAMCSQCYLPNSFTRSSKMVELWFGVFSLLIKTAFGALLIVHMTKTVNKPPFHDLNSLVDNTKYSVVVLNGSLSSVFFQLKEARVLSSKVIKANRVVYLNSTKEVYERGCSSNKMSALLLTEDVKKARGVYFCRLNPTEVTINQPVIAFGLALNFTYKRTIDIGMLKLHEMGIINLLKQRWIEMKNAEDVSNIMEATNLEQVYLILLIFLCGLLISLIILMIENITFYYKN